MGLPRRRVSQKTPARERGFVGVLAPQVEGERVSTGDDLAVARIEPLGEAMRLYDITTETGDFIANGVVSHNCFARPSHAYKNLSPGIDFETRIFAKPNAADTFVWHFATDRRC